MHPVLFHIGSMTVYTYGVLVATGVVVGLYLARRQAPISGLDPDRVWNLGIYIVLAALVASKLWMLLSDWSYYMQNPGEIFSFATLQSGGVFYGGLVGAIILLVLYVWRQHMSFLSVADVFAAPLALGHAIGRLGCFSAGCCWGKPTHLPWGVVFTNPLAGRLVGTPLGVPLHPTQLYEAFAEFCNFVLLAWMGRRRKFTGELFGTYMILYGFERGTIEFVRGDPGRTLMFNGAVSLMQFVSVGLILAGAWLWRRGTRRGGQPAAMAAPAAVRR
jgi:phosphatidylglycerol---prolipoprotein diacylglyceryl transferase